MTLWTSGLFVVVKGPKGWVKSICVVILALAGGMLLPAGFQKVSKVIENRKRLLMSNVKRLVHVR